MPFPKKATIANVEVEILGPDCHILPDGSTFTNHQEVVIRIGGIIARASIESLENIEVSEQETQEYEAEFGKTYIDVVKLVKAMQK